MSLGRVLARVMERPRQLRLLLLDEFDSALDRDGRALAADAVRRIRELSGCGVVRVTHSPLGPEFDRCAAVRLRAGRVVARGEYKDVVAEACPAEKDKEV